MRMKPPLKYLSIGVCYGLFCLLFAAHGQESTVFQKFNFEISNRVLDEVGKFFEIINRCVDRFIDFQIKLPRNNVAGDSLNFGPQALFPAKVTFPEVDNIYIGFESGFFFGYALISGKVVWRENALWGKTRVNRVFSINDVGIPQKYESNYTYDPRVRQWYKDVKKYGKTMWSAPYISASNNLPSVTLARPYSYQSLNLPISGSSVGSRSFGGAVGADVTTGDISKYLKSISENSNDNRTVFVVERGSGRLLGASSNTATYSIDPITKKTQFIIATSCESPVISEASKQLIANNFRDLIIFKMRVPGSTFEKYKFYYCQSIFFNSSSIPGIQWDIGVVLPAPDTFEYIAEGTASYYTAVALTSIVLIISVICIITILALNFSLFNPSQRFKVPNQIYALLVLFGGFLLSVYGIVMLGDNTGYRCTARPILFNLGCTFSFAPLIYGCFRLWLDTKASKNSPGEAKTIKHRKRSSIVHQLRAYMAKEDRHVDISTKHLFKFVFALVVLDLVVVMIGLYAFGDMTQSTTELDDVQGNQGALSHITYCKYMKEGPLMISEYVFKVALLNIGCTIAFRCRNLSGGRLLLILIFNGSFVGGAAALVAGVMSNHHQIVLMVELVCILKVVTVNASFLAVSPCLEALWYAWKEASVRLTKRLATRIFQNGSQVLPNPIPVDGNARSLQERVRFNDRNEKKPYSHNESDDNDADNEGDDADDVEARNEIIEPSELTRPSEIVNRRISALLADLYDDD